MDDANILIELQDRDLRSLRVQKQLDEMPEKRAILAARAKIAEVEGLLGRTQAAVRAIDANIKRFEDQTAELETKIQAEQSKILSGAVKNPKEVQAISMELAALKRRQEKLENDELAEMTKRETGAAQAAKITAALDGGRRKEAEMVELFKKHGGELVAVLDSLNAEREKLAKKLPADMRQRYEAVRETRKGIAVGVLEGTTCSICRVSLPSGKLDALLRGPDVSECPQCHRILVVRKPLS